jgi:hypothetical protein
MKSDVQFRRDRAVRARGSTGSIEARQPFNKDAGWAPLAWLTRKNDLENHLLDYRAALLFGRAGVRCHVRLGGLDIFRLEPESGEAAAKSRRASNR